MTERLDMIVFVGLGEHDRNQVGSLLGATQGDENGGGHDELWAGK
jgi:hypothetical protein